jgi:Tol biopolymer transport system component
MHRESPFQESDMLERPRRYAPPIAVALLALSLPVAAEWSLDRMELISRVPFATGDANYGLHDAGARAFSADGRYLAWSSSSSAIVPGVLDHNGGSDLFLTDLEAGTTTLISHRPGDPGHASTSGLNFSPYLSADGRYVFYSSATYIQGILQWDMHAYLYDRLTTTRQLITHAAGGTGEANGASYLMDISADGRYVALGSVATDLIAGLQDTPGTWDVFLWDRLADSFQLVSHRPDAPLVAATAAGTPGALSADGRFLAFSADADLMAKGLPKSPQIYLFDRQTGANTLVTASPSGEPTGGDSVVDLTPDGRFLLFAQGSDLLLFDRRKSTIELISRRDAAGPAGNAESAYGALSDDGLFVYFVSLATNLVAGIVDTPGTPDLFLRDRAAQTTSLVSKSATDPNLAVGVLESYRLHVQSDGARVVFDSFSTALAAGTVGSDGPFSYRYDRASGQTTLLSHAPSQPNQAVHAHTLAMSPEGERYLWSTRSTSILTGIADPQLDGNDPVVHDRIRGVSTPLNQAAFAGFESGVGGFFEPAVPRMSDDGRRVAFATSARSCAPTQPVPPNAERACLLDRQSGEMRLLSHRWDDPAIAIPAATTRLLEFSQDGRWLLLDSSELGMAPTDVAHTCDLFLYDTDQRTFELVSNASSGSTIAAGLSCQSPTEWISVPPARSDRPLLSGDALRVLFTSEAGNLDPGIVDGNGEADVYLKDRSTGITRLLTSTAAAPAQAANGASRALEISADGRFALVHSTATDLLTDFVDGNGADGDLFLFDLQLGTRLLVSRATRSPLQGGNAEANTFAAMSTDGRFVAFTSKATDHAAGVDDAGEDNDVFLFDRGNGSITLVSHVLGQLLTAEGPAHLQDLSSDGRFVLFLSEKDEVPRGWPFGPFHDLFRWERLDGGLRLVSHRDGQPEIPIGAEWGRLSADGRRVLLVSADSRATAIEDNNQYHDLFAWDGADASLSLISRRFEDPPRTGNSLSPTGVVPPQINKAGDLLLFASGASDLVGAEHDGNQGGDFFLAHLRDGFFSDGFESGDVSAWSAARP